MKKKAAKRANGKSNGKAHGKSNGKPAARRKKTMAKMRATYELNDKELKVWEAFPAPKDGEDAKSGVYTRTKLTPKEVLEAAEAKGLINSKDTEEKKPKRKKKASEKAEEATA